MASTSKQTTLPTITLWLPVDPWPWPMGLLAVRPVLPRDLGGSRKGTLGNSTCNFPKLLRGSVSKAQTKREFKHPSSTWWVILSKHRWHRSLPRLTIAFSKASRKPMCCTPAQPTNLNRVVGSAHETTCWRSQHQSWCPGGPRSGCPLEWLRGTPAQQTCRSRKRMHSLWDGTKMMMATNTWVSPCAFLKVGVS